MKWKRRPSLSLWWWWCIHTRTSMDTQTVDTHTLVHFFPSFLSLFFGYFIRFFLEHTLSVSRTRSGTAEWCPPVKREMEAMQQAACVSPAGVTLDDGRSKEKCAAVMFTFFSLFSLMCSFLCRKQKRGKILSQMVSSSFSSGPIKNRSIFSPFSGWQPSVDGAPAPRYFFWQSFLRNESTYQQWWLYKHRQ